MCINCGDWIDMCSQCPGPNPKGPLGKYKSFYIDMPYCEHKRAEYGHEFAQWEDRYGDEEDEP